MTRSDLLSLARQCGLDGVAAVSAVSLEFVKPWLRERQAKGLYPAFAEPNLDKRIHAASVLPTAQVVLTASLAYRTADQTHDREPLRRLHGRLSRYARGRDYHRVLPDRLMLLAEKLKDHVPLQGFQVAVDSTPLAERAWALTSGLGVQRWNTCLYVQPYGSYVFLGELLMDVEPSTFPLQESSWAPDDTCQECRRCLQACPTGALLPLFQLNPQKCLAYWTQAKEAVPADVRPHWGAALWGCDICQDVCPQNSHSTPSPHEALEPILPAQLPLRTILELTNREFRHLFGSTAAAWRGRGVLQRNAAMAMGAQQDPETIPWLCESLSHHPQPLVRGSSAWALGQMRTKDAIFSLNQAWKNETNGEVRREVEQALNPDIISFY